MANLLEYGLLLTADLVIIGCVVHYFVTALHWHSLPIDEAWRHRSTLARLDKLKMYSYYAVLWVGIGLALYGSLRFLFSWMPHRWVDDNGNWIGMFPSIMGAFFGMGALVSGLGQTVDKDFKIAILREECRGFRKTN